MVARFSGKDINYLTFYADIENIDYFTQKVNDFFDKNILFPKLQTGGNNINIRLNDQQIERIKICESYISILDNESVVKKPPDDITVNDKCSDSSNLNSNKLNRLGWSNKTNLNQGLLQTKNWIENNFKIKQFEIDKIIEV